MVQISYAFQIPSLGLFDLNGNWSSSGGGLAATPVHISQNGSAVISSFQPLGDCRARPDWHGTGNAETTVDFHATFSGNRLAGEGYLCDPDSLRLHPIQLTISSDGNKLNGTIGNSPVSYTRVSTPSTDLTLPLIGIGGVSAAAVTGGYAVKKIVKKHGKPHEKEAKEKLPVIRLGINCGIEGINVEEAIAPSTGEIKKIEEQFGHAIDTILENRSKIEQIREDKEFVHWCREAKEDPNQILSKITDDVVKKFLGSIEPYFSRFFKVSVDSQVKIIDDEHNKKARESQTPEVRNPDAKFNVNFSLPPIEPYIQLVVFVDEIPKSAVKLVFSIDTDITVENLGVYSNIQSNKMVDFGNLVVSLQISISKLSINRFIKRIDPPIILGRREFVTNKLSVLASELTPTIIKKDNSLLSKSTITRGSPFPPISSSNSYPVTQPEPTSTKVSSTSYGKNYRRSRRKILLPIIVVIASIFVVFAVLGISNTPLSYITTLLPKMANNASHNTTAATPIAQGNMTAATPIAQGNMTAATPIAQGNMTVANSAGGNMTAAPNEPPPPASPPCDPRHSLC